jgi:hypothetical protein
LYKPRFAQEYKLYSQELLGQLGYLAWKHRVGFLVRDSLWSEFLCGMRILVLFPSKYKRASSNVK